MLASLMAVSAACRRSPKVALLLGWVGGTALVGCGPELAYGEEERDDFLAVAEQSIDTMCTRIEACEEQYEDHQLIAVYGPFPDDSCYEPLVDSTERIYEGERCIEPETMLALYDCIAAIDCAPTIMSAREPCAHEFEAVEAALCYPF